MLRRIGTHKPKYFAVFDLTSGYHQAPLSMSAIGYTAFICFCGLYEYLRVPFGLKGAPSYFQRVIASVVLAGLIYVICEVYIDDIIIFSENEEEHAKHVAQVFDLLKEAGLKMKGDKCHFGVDEMNVLGFNFRPDGIRPQEEKIKAVVDAKVAKTKHGIMKFLGLVRYYQRFVPKLAELAQPLTSMLKKEKTPKDWGPEQDLAIARIKTVFQSADVLTHF